MIGKVCILIVFTILALGAPLIGVYLSGRSVVLFASFPPLTTPAAHQPFSWPVFMLYLLPAVGISGLVGIAARRNPPASQSGSPGITRNLPLWGWVALAVLLVSWFFAWTRFTWFGSCQRHTFIPLWFSYIVFANALCVRQSGTCPMLHEPVFFAGLFPLSAVFWWFFEYLNQFSQNWYYTGVSYGTLAYSMHATISFSTVLPAVYTTRRWISQMEWFRKRFSRPAFPQGVRPGISELADSSDLLRRPGRGRPMAGGVVFPSLAGASSAPDRPAAYCRSAHSLYRYGRWRLAPCGICRHGCPGMRLFLGNVELLQSGQMGVQYSLCPPLPAL